jgi:type IV pilus assembly protein PilP
MFGLSFDSVNIPKFGQLFELKPKWCGMVFKYNPILIRFFEKIRLGVVIFLLLFFVSVQVQAQDQNQGGLNFQVDVKTGTGSAAGSGSPQGVVQPPPQLPGLVPPPEQMAPLFDQPQIPSLGGPAVLPPIEPGVTLTPAEAEAREAKLAFYNELNKWHGSILEGYKLNLSGAEDPFMPIESVLVVEDDTEKKRQRDRERPPIQRLALNQFTLTAIVVSDNSDNNTALVDSGGVGYLIRKGTMIGNNEGYVREITTTKVIIEEPEHNYRGDKKSRVTEFKLNALDDDPSNLLSVDVTDNN